ncbi:MAG TPA: ABC transporter permease subunit [Clostridia bacterium]|nr:ABC transporter permease subunit [Clostridia bacterium]
MKRHTRWILLLFGIYLLLPILILALFSLTGETEGWTLAHYRLLFSDKAFWDALGHTMTITAASVSITLAVMAPLGFVVVAYVPRMEKWIKALMLTPYALPGVITAVALLQSYSNLGVSTVTLLGGAYCLLVMPLVYQSVSNSLYAMDIVPLTQAAQTLGASPLQIFLRIVLPGILPGVLTGGLISIAALFGEFVLASILVGAKWPTVQYYLYEAMGSSSRLAAAVVISYIALMAFLCVLFLALTPLQRHRDIQAKGD